MDISREWTALLSRLDRQVSSGRLSPDTATLPELMNLYQVPAVSVAVGQIGGPVWTAGFGVPEDTVFAACSISKHVAAFGALRLVQQGVVELDTDIGEYLTSWQLPGRSRVTVRQLLAHTAGLSDTWYRGYPADRVPSLPQVLDGSAPATTPPIRSTLLPGSRFRYSGSHYTVLQQLLAEVTGSPFEDLMRTLVLEPVGMAGSSFDQGFPAEPGRSVAHGHHGGGTEVPGGWRNQPEMAAAGLWSTPADLLRLDLEIARAAAGDSELLDRDLAGQMWTSPIPGGGYGLGTELGDHRFGHTGQNVGYTCFSYVWPDHGVAVAAMTNSDDGWELLSAIRAAADRRYARRVSSAPLEEVAGRYALRDDYPIDIAVRGGEVTFSAPGQEAVVLVAQADGRYLHPALDLEIRFRPGSHVMELRQEGSVQIAS